MLFVQVGEGCDPRRSHRAGDIEKVRLRVLCEVEVGVRIQMLALVHADVFEPDGTAVFAVEPIRAVGKTSSYAARTFVVVGAVEEGYVLVADVAEPFHLLLAFLLHARGW